MCTFHKEWLFEQFAKTLITKTAQCYFPVRSKNCTKLHSYWHLTLWVENPNLSYALRCIVESC